MVTKTEAPTPTACLVPSPAVREGVAALMAELAHELRNPVAALQGCAQTLSERGDQLSPSTRAGLTDIVVRHARRVDWLVGAALALAGSPDGVDMEIDLTEIATKAGRLAGVEISSDGPVIIVGVRGRVAMACEALLIALGTEGAEVRVGADGTLQARAPVHDLQGAGRGWKLGLVSTLAAQEGGRLDLDRQAEPMSATLRFRTHGGR